MPQRKMRKLVTATIAAGLIGGLAFGSPLGIRRSRTGSGSVRSAARARPPRRPRPRLRSIRPPRSSRRRRRRGPRRGRAPGRSAGRAARRPRRPARAAGRPARAAAAPQRPPTRSPRGRRRFPRAPPRARTRRRTPVSRCSLPPSFNPVNGSMVGVAKPIIINFQRPIADRPMAEQAIHISSNPPVPGKFYWMSDTQVRWRPLDFWPANTTVNIDAGGAKSSFRTGESLVATIDDKTHQMTITPQRQGREDLPGVDGQARRQARDQERHLLRAGEVRRHRDGLRDLRRARTPRRRATS